MNLFDAFFGGWTAIATNPANVGSYRSRCEHQVVTVRGDPNYKW